MADYMLVFVPQKSGSSSTTSLTAHTNDSGFLALAIVVFFLLCSDSPSTVCLQRAHLMCMLCLFFSVFGEFQVPPIGLEYELQRGSVWTQIFLKRCQERSFWYVWSRPKSVPDSLRTSSHPETLVPWGPIACSWLLRVRLVRNLSSYLNSLKPEAPRTPSVLTSYVTGARRSTFQFDYPWRGICLS